MTLSNSYARALAANLPVCALFVSWLWAGQSVPGLAGFGLAAAKGLVPGLVATLTVGVCLRTRAGVRGWPAFGLASLAGWFVLLVLALLLMGSFC